MKIYTKKGDDGGTGLFDGTRVKKSHARIETYGTVDELNSAIGLAIASSKHSSLNSLLLDLQKQLFTLGGDLATPPNSKSEIHIQRITPQHITTLEHHIDAATAQLPELKRFILPGGSLAAAHLHLGRTICRRAERLLVTLMETEPVSKDALIYLNRLSDLLFTLARLANKLDNHPDIEWLPGE